MIKKGIDYVYNFQFSNAEKINSELEKLYPGHPIGYLYRGLITYWENYPLIPDVRCKRNF